MEYHLRPATNEDRDAVEHLVFSVLAEYGLNPDPDGTDSDLHDVHGSYHASGGSFDVLTDESGRSWALLACSGFRRRSANCARCTWTVARAGRARGDGCLRTPWHARLRWGLRGWFWKLRQCLPRRSPFMNGMAFGAMLRSIWRPAVMRRIASTFRRRTQGDAEEKPAECRWSDPAAHSSRPRRRSVNRRNPNALKRAAERAFHLCSRMPATFATAEYFENVSRLFHAALTAMRIAWTVRAHEE